MHVRLAVVLCGCLVIAACSTSSPARQHNDDDPSRPHAATSRRTVRTAIQDPTQLPGTRAWRLTRPARDGQIEGYATASSGRPGARVGLRVSTSSRSFRVRAYRIGSYVHGDGRRVWSSRWLPGRRQPPATFAPAATRTVVAPWRTNTVVDTRGWSPGLYVFKLLARSGWQAQVPYIVSSASADGRVALVAPVTTWQAYNDWGGYSLYVGPPGDRRSWAVSFDRPYPAPGAGEMRFGVVPVVVAAERLGVPLAYLTTVDLDRRDDALSGALAYVSMGHDEYWTRAMRRHVEQARDRGTNLLFLGANTMYWRIRLTDVGGRAGRTMTSYKIDAALDPAPSSRRTGMWRSAPDPQPENTLTGMEYECFPVDAPFRVVSPHWWGFAGTHVRRGEGFDHLVGVEADRVYPVPGTPHPLQVLAHASYSCRGVTTSTEASYYTTSSGAGVLDVGTLQWTCALADRCRAAITTRTVRFVNRVTANVLRGFARGPVGRSHPAHDNVARFGLSSQNLVPAS